MNYSIIFTEISFYPETSILLQIIRTIHVTSGIIPESDREGRAVCQFWLQGGIHNETPTDNSPGREPLLGDLRAPPPFKRKSEGANQVPLKVANSVKGQGQANKTCQAGWKRDHSSCCH